MRFRHTVYKILNISAPKIEIVSPAASDGLEPCRFQTIRRYRTDHTENWILNDRCVETITSYKSDFQQEWWFAYIVRFE